jgi:hypothetical protein
MLCRHNKTAILALDRAGNPTSWISFETAIHLLVTERVIAPLGQETRVFYGGTNRLSGLRSSIEVSSTLLTQAKVVPRLWTEGYVPPLTNRALFERDMNTCQYCGKSFSPSWRFFGINTTWYLQSHRVWVKLL